MYSRVTGTGSYLPSKILTNHDLAERVETSDDWIVERTGIRQRRIAADGENTSDLALAASLAAIAAAGIKPDQIDLIIVATTTPDKIFPSTACILQSKLGIRGCPAFDVQAVCSGFIYAMATADQFIRSGQNKCVLVVGAETMSRIVDWNDRGTCILFGDGAGAVIMQTSDAPGILSTHLHADGSLQHLLEVPGNIRDGQIQGAPYIVMDGGAVFKFAVNALDHVVEEALAANHMEKSEVDWLVPHQANLRIIRGTAKKLGMGMDRVVVTLESQGNTSAASIPLALDTAVRDGRIQRGETLLLEGIGGGFAWGAVLLRW
ncbi:MAG: ketoacyl-ACP synthase III [Sulfuricellaceae bacterium]|nr:ketoacyl-ACP synthase III [Sulfuricellaceae bacterium]